MSGARPRGAARASWAALALALVTACAGPREGTAVPAPVATPLAAARVPSASAEFAPALDAVRAALQAGEDDVARRALAVVFARGPAGEDLELAEAFSDVLSGRELARNLDLRLVATPDAEVPARTRLVLHGSAGLPPGLRLEFPGPAVVVDLEFAGARGELARATDVESAGAAMRMVVPAEGPLVVDLGSFTTDPSGALASRETWRLDLGAGVAWTTEGRRLPLRTVAVVPAERQRVAAFLPEAPLDGAPLAAFLVADRAENETTERWTARLMERAVRIPPERREAALDAVAEVFPSLSDQRIEEAQSALRWLARSRSPRSPMEWRRWFDQRDGARRLRVDERGRLELPESPPGGPR